LKPIARDDLIEIQTFTHDTIPFSLSAAI